MFFVVVVFAKICEARKNYFHSVKPTVNKVATSAGQILHIGFVCLNLKKKLTLNIYMYVYYVYIFPWIIRVTTELLKI